MATEDRRKKKKYKGAQVTDCKVFKTLWTEIRKPPKCKRKAGQNTGRSAGLPFPAEEINKPNRKEKMKDNSQIKGKFNRE